MNFKELLNEYYKGIQCTQTELANASQLSTSVISRYLNGERQPAMDSQQLEALAKGISSIAESKQLSDKEYSYSLVLSRLKQSLKTKEISYERFSDNFSTIIECFNINIKAFAFATNFDVSYIYRVRSGERHPSDMDSFCELVSSYICDNYNSDKDLSQASKLLGCEMSAIKDSQQYKRLIKNYLQTPTEDEDNSSYMKNFLEHLDTFDLDEYIRSIHFDELKVPSVPFQLPSSKKYYGSVQMRRGELDFFKATVLSKSMEPIFMCNDMPMMEMAEDIDFNKKWMFGIAMSLKKGLHLNMIHDINRPFNEMMLGLEAWLPIYMTGQISPFYLPKYEASIYHHINYVSGTVALTGECIHDNHEDGMYYLTNNKEEVSYYKKKAGALLSKAMPLMEVYTRENRNDFRKLQLNQAENNKKCHNLLSVPGLYCISDELLDRILQDNHIDPDLMEEIKTYVSELRTNFELYTRNNDIYEEILEINEQEFLKHPVSLFVAEMFLDREINYTYDEYKQHLYECEEFAKTHERYSVSLTSSLVFRNIQIHIKEGENVLISKAKAPLIHINVRHPKLVSALENFTPLV